MPPDKALAYSFPGSVSPVASSISRVSTACLRHAVETRLDLKGMLRCEEGVDVQLLWNDTDRGPRHARILVLIEAPDADRSGILDYRPGEHVDEC